jgi:hypothetical protein
MTPNSSKLKYVRKAAVVFMNTNSVHWTGCKVRMNFCIKIYSMRQAPKMRGNLLTKIPNIGFKVRCNLWIHKFQTASKVRRNCWTSKLGPGAKLRWNLWIKIILYEWAIELMSKNVRYSLQNMRGYKECSEVQTRLTVFHAMYSLYSLQLAD